MKYAKERNFLRLLPDFMLDEFLKFNVLNDIEKKIIYYMFKEQKSIRDIADLGLLNYEKSSLYHFYENGLLKIREWIKKTEKKAYKQVYKIF